MTHVETQNLAQVLDALIKYVVDNKIKSTYLNYGLNKNVRILEQANKIVQDNVSEELKALEKKATEFGQELIKDFTEEEKENYKRYDQVFQLGYDNLTEEEKEEHAGLMKDYNAFMKEESDVKLYLLDFEKISDLPFEFSYTNALMNFLKE